MSSITSKFGSLALVADQRFSGPFGDFGGALVGRFLVNAKLAREARETGHFPALT